MSRQSSSAASYPSAFMATFVTHAHAHAHAAHGVHGLHAVHGLGPTPPPALAQPALARGFTALDMDAAEALSTLAIACAPSSSSPSPGTSRLRAHTVSHNAHPYAAPVPYFAAPSSSPSRYSAPAALHTGTGTAQLGTSTATSTSHNGFGYEGAFTTLFSLNATRTPASPDERHAMRRALHATQTGTGTGTSPGAGLVAAEGGAGTRRLVESPSGKPCPNCHAATSTLWRSCALLSGQHYLCNACGLRFKKGKYCPLCTRVYYDADTHAGTFKQCARCGSWSHKACLARAGTLSEHELREPSPFERAAPYTCTRCTGHAPRPSATTSDETAARRDEGDSDASSVDRMQF